MVFETLTFLLAACCLTLMHWNETGNKKFFINIRLHLEFFLLLFNTNKKKQCLMRHSMTWAVDPGKVVMKKNPYRNPRQDLPFCSLTKQANKNVICSRERVWWFNWEIFNISFEGVNKSGTFPSWEKLPVECK